MTLLELDHALRKLRLSGMADVLEVRLHQGETQPLSGVDSPSLAGPGDWVAVDINGDVPLLDVRSNGELLALLGHLEQVGKIQKAADGRWGLTIEGWKALEPSGAGGVPGRCFVAMSFDPSLNDAFEQGGLTAVKTDCRLDAVRIDLMQHNEKICDRILAELRLAQVVVADFTFHRPASK